MRRPGWIFMALIACQPIEVDILRVGGTSVVSDGGTSVVPDGGTQVCTAGDPSCGNAPGMYCDLSGSSCGSTGVCAVRPSGGGGDCGGPVCGCDGVSYDNVCVAADLHAAVFQKDGPCDEIALVCDRRNPCPQPAECALIGTDNSCAMVVGICYVLPGPGSGLTLSKVHTCGGRCISIAEAIASETVFDGPCGP